MKNKWKILLGIVALLIIAGVAFGYTKFKEGQIPKVQTSRVVRSDLASIVTASGEIKPRNYINIGSYYTGRITDLLVREGDRVSRGQTLARLESIQAQADLEAARANLSSVEAESAAAEAQAASNDQAIATNEAALARARAELQRAQLDFQRSEQLFKEKLIAKSEYDQANAAYNAQQAAIREAEARIAQAKAQKAQALQQQSAAQRRVAQVRANLKRSSDILDKFTAVAPIDGMVTNLPVRVGETVVPGIQNALGTTIMTIADMSVITAEVKVDETDIVNVRLDQVTDVSIDAIPDKTFKGKVIEIGNTAILRSTGVAASQSQNSSQEAKDFKVVVALIDPPAEIRPGLSCTARITTATRSNVLTVPIQALTTRTKGDLLKKPGNQGKPDSVPGTLNPADKSLKQELVGVFVMKGGKAVFQEVKTGITGATEMEVLSGLNEKDEIVTGSFRTIKTLANETQVKVDNSRPQTENKPT